jgi:translation initiation factor 3 subunit C
VNSIVSRMIWTEELPASLDQSAGVIVFHRVELTRPQQLAQILAEKVGALVEQNEKALDIRLGGVTTWGDRVDGVKGDKRGEQAQERRGRGERRGGASARGKSRVRFLMAFITHKFVYTIKVQELDEEHALHRDSGVR